MDLRPCDGCSLCKLRCAEGVEMTIHEYRVVQQYVASPERTVETRRVLEQDKQVDLGDGVSVTMCRYLDMEEGGCVVYEARPLICRLLGHVQWMPCPVGKIEQEARTEDALALMREYAGEERLKFEQWDERLKTEAAVGRSDQTA